MTRFHPVTDGLVVSAVRNSSCFAVIVGYNFIRIFDASNKPCKIIREKSVHMDIDDFQRNIFTPLGFAYFYQLHNAIHVVGIRADHDSRVLIRPELFTGRRVNVQIETHSELTLGMTVADWWGVTDRPKNALFIGDLDTDGFFDLLTERLARL